MIQDITREKLERACKEQGGTWDGSWCHGRPGDIVSIGLTGDSGERAVHVPFEDVWRLSWGGLNGYDGNSGNSIS